jgi:hypothetical protein
MPDFSVGAVVVCDDVRKEVSSKDIIVGAFGGSILVASFPAQAPLAVWIEVIPHQAGRQEIDLKIEAPGIAAEFRLRFVVEISVQDEGVSIFTPQMMIPLGAPGEIVFSVKEAESEIWRIVKTKPVVTGRAPQAAHAPEIHPGPPPGQTQTPGGAVIASSPTASQPPSGRSPDAAPATKPRRVPRHPSARRSGRTPAPE